MEKKIKEDLSKYLVIAGLVLLFCFGLFMFSISVGSVGVIELLVLIGAVLGLFAILIKVFPKAVMPLFYLLFTSMVLYTLYF